MLTRREAILGTAASFAAASQPSTKVNFHVPPGACDCHTQIFGDPQRFPMFPARTYTPEPASVAEIRALRKSLHIDRVVIVQPSSYGIDKSSTLDAMKQLGKRARAIAVIDETISAAALDELNRAGVLGIRIILATTGQNDPAVARRRFQAALEWVRGRGWHIQIFTQLAVIVAIRDVVAASPVPVVFDHFGGAQADLGVNQPGFDALVELLRSGKAYVKITAPYRSSKLKDYS